MCGRHKSSSEFKDGAAGSGDGRREKKHPILEHVLFSEDKVLLPPRGGARLPPSGRRDPGAECTGQYHIRAEAGHGNWRTRSLAVAVAR